MTRKAYLRVTMPTTLYPNLPPIPKPYKTDYGISDEMACAIMEGRAKVEVVYVDFTPREYREPVKVHIHEPSRGIDMTRFECNINQPLPLRDAPQAPLRAPPTPGTWLVPRAGLKADCGAGAPGPRDTAPKEMTHA